MTAHAVLIQVSYSGDILKCFPYYRIESVYKIIYFALCMVERRSSTSVRGSCFNILKVKRAAKCAFYHAITQFVVWWALQVPTVRFSVRCTLQGSTVRRQGSGALSLFFVQKRQQFSLCEMSRVRPHRQVADVLNAALGKVCALSTPHTAQPHL